MSWLGLFLLVWLGLLLKPTPTLTNEQRSLGAALVSACITFAVWLLAQGRW